MLIYEMYGKAPSIWKAKHEGRGEKLHCFQAANPQADLCRFVLPPGSPNGSGIIPSRPVSSLGPGLAPSSATLWRL